MFKLTKEQEMLRTMVREFADRELAPVALELDRKGEFPRDIVKKVAALGLLGICTPKEMGGAGMGHLASTLAIEEVGRVCPSMAFFMENSTGPLYSISHFGSEDQKKKYVSPIMKGEKMMCFAATEPSGGSEVTNLGTEAAADGDQYVINGRKVFITGGGIADYCILLAKTGDKASLFMVEKGVPGFSIGRRQEQTGLKALNISELAFNDCRIPRSGLIGKEGAGFQMAIATFTIARIAVASVGLGIARGAFEIALKYAKERILYKKPIASLQAVQFLLAEMDTEIDAARWLVYAPGEALDRGIAPRDIGKLSARAKMVGAEAAMNVTRKAIEILGGNGVSPEYNLARLANDALELLPATGTQQIMKIIQAMEILR